jgi:hypothetical protein
VQGRERPKNNNTSKDNKQLPSPPPYTRANREGHPQLKNCTNCGTRKRRKRGGRERAMEVNISAAVEQMMM